MNDPARCVQFWEKLCHFLGMKTLVRNEDPFRMANQGDHRLGRGVSSPLVLAVVDAGWELDRRSGWHSVLPRHRARWRTQQTHARRWLLGDLDEQVALPIAFVCDMLGLDAGVLAAAVRARIAP